MHCLVDELMELLGLRSNVPSKGVKLLAGNAFASVISSEVSTSETRQDYKNNQTTEIGKLMCSHYRYKPPDRIR